MRRYDNCRLRKKAIASGIGDCGQEKGQGCRGYASTYNHGEPVEPCKKCSSHYLNLEKEPEAKPKFSDSLLREWDHVTKAARMLKEGTGKIVVENHNGCWKRFVKPIEK